MAESPYDVLLSGPPESDDDDTDFHPASGDDSEEAEFFDPEDTQDDWEEEENEEETNDEATNDEDGNGVIEVEVSLNEGAEQGEGVGVGSIRIIQGNGASVPRMSRQDLFTYLRRIGFSNLLSLEDGEQDGTDDVEDDVEDLLRGYSGGRRRRRPASTRPSYPPVPSPEGQALMRSGIFGSSGFRNDHLVDKKRLARRLLARELTADRTDAIKSNKLISQGLIPSSEADTIINYDERCYSGQFSDDGNFFFSCAQDFIVRMYDTSNPYDWKHYKSVAYLYPQWTITDATLSPDNKYLAYTSIRNIVCLASTDPTDTRDPWVLNFAMSSRSGRIGYGEFGIWSVRFSGDGRELVAGTGDNSVYVYDLETNRSILRIRGHRDHVNAVCFGDKSSPHILYSGSDDSLIKVWDRRSLRDNREAGVFVGHTEGLTYVDSKGDGRYVLSNGKDQTMKLWDLRKMMSTEQCADIEPSRYTTGFDYRFRSFSDRDFNPHPHDCSVVTFRGHRVLKTLIRCHFSPPGSTDSRYVYSGSQDGKVYIYNLDATVAGIIDVQAATHNTRPYDPDQVEASWDIDDGRGTGWKTCVRDASWHPYVPMVAATSFNGWGGLTGTCSVHSWHDGPAEDESGIATGRRVDSEMQDDPALYEAEVSRRTGLRPRRWGRVR